MAHQVTASSVTSAAISSRRSRCGQVVTAPAPARAPTAAGLASRRRAPPPGPPAHGQPDQQQQQQQGQRVGLVAAGSRASWPSHRAAHSGPLNPSLRTRQKCSAINRPRHQREHDAVQHIEADQRRRLPPRCRPAGPRARRGRAPTRAAGPSAPTSGEPRPDVGRHGGGPVALLVPGQQVAGEGDGQGQHQQDHADDPVELPRRLVGPGQQHPHHVHEDGDHHAVAGVAMQAAQEARRRAPLPQQHQVTVRVAPASGR